MVKDIYNDNITKTSTADDSFAAKLNKMTSLEQRYDGVVCAIGDPGITKQLKRDLEKKGVRVRTYKTVSKLREEFTGSEDAIVYCSPLVRSHLQSVHKNLKKSGKFQGIPFFAIIQNWTDPMSTRALYKMGLRMVFKWPRERFSFSELISRALDKETIAVQSDDTDKALKKAIVNRMIAKNANFNPKIEFHVYHGIVIFEGSVDSIGEKIELSNFVKKIPGVRGVIDASLEVKEEALPGMLKSRANNLLEDMESVPDKTLMVRTSPGSQKLRVVGTAASQQTLERTKRKLQLFKGVKKVEMDVKVSPRIHARDLALAKKAQNIANKITLASPHMVNVKILRGEAFLLGDVASEIESDQLDNAIRKIDGIKSLENRLQVDRTTRMISNF